MGRKPTARFDAKAFLTKASTGRSVYVYRKKQVVFVQGDPADAVFYLDKGQIKLTVVSERGKSAVVAMLWSNRHAQPRWLAPQSGWSRAGSLLCRIRHRLFAVRPSVAGAT